jgi:4-amino-4-deoxy-L-arabinose transferase-like glycosyltransferase
MPRVVLWLQYESVEHFPAHNVRHVFQPPFAEYVILHLQALSGGDRLANIPQWLALVGIITIASLVAKQLGGTARAQLFAAIMCASLPIAVLQASSTLNDLVLAFWVVVVMSLLLDLRARDLSTVSYADVVILGLGLGLAVLTKGTAYVLVLPICVWIGVWVLRSGNRRMIALLAFVPLIAVAINAPHYVRNAEAFGSPFAPQSQQNELRNEAMNPAIFVSNVVRNVALHAVTPGRLWYPVVVRPVARFHEVLGLDMDDPRTTYPGSRFEEGWPRFDEGLAGSPLHLLLIVCGGMALCIHPRLRRQRVLVVYAVCVGVMYVLFIMLFKWQPWHTRLHIPGFVLSASLVGVVLSNLVSLRALRVLGALLLLASLPWLLLGDLRPVLGSENVFMTLRDDLYFAVFERRQAAYEEVAHIVEERRCDRVGLVTDDQEFEYPLWATLGNFGQGAPWIEHVFVENETRRIADQTPHAQFDPCLIVTLGQQATARWGDDELMRTEDVAVAVPDRARGHGGNLTPQLLP